jgi:hypothetical protein
MVPLPSQPRGPSWRELFAIVYEQAWGLCVAYLGLGLLAELLRRRGLTMGARAQQFLDGIPFFAIRAVGQTEPYLSAVALGQLTPFWNRVLLTCITLSAIVLQATLVGLLVALLFQVFARRREAG